MNFLLVILGGGIGSLLRYSIGLLIKTESGKGFPTSTFIVNITGAFLIGLSAALAMKFKWSESTTLFVMTGILAGFTTFSSFSLEFFQLIKNNQAVMAFIYLGLSNFVGIGLCALGYYLVK